MAQKRVTRREGLELYNSLYKLYSLIKKESERVELILGSGKLLWETEEYIIDHPLLLQKVTLSMDISKPSFIVNAEEIKTEIYMPMLRKMKDIDQDVLLKTVNEVEKDICHVADEENTLKTVEKIISVMNTNEHSSKPEIKNNGVLFLRKRTLGYSSFFEKILEDIEENKNKEIPDFFKSILGSKEEFKNNSEEKEKYDVSGIEEDVLLTLPANSDQLKIVKYLEGYGSVLVQGPPGTGKTHTIANLIGDLLSKGNNILVTSQTEKALKVVKEKVYIELQSLCISLLSGSSEKNEMDKILFEMIERGSYINLDNEENSIKVLIEERKKLIEELKNSKLKLKQSMSLEYTDLIYNNKNIKPIDAAKFIYENKGKEDYIEGYTRDNTIGVPLSNKELEELYSSNSLITLEEEKILNSNLPKIEELWNLKIFCDNVDKYRETENVVLSWKSTISLQEDLDNSKINNMLEKCYKILENFNMLNNAQHIIINKTTIDREYKKLFLDVIYEYKEIVKEEKVCRKINLDNDIDIPEEYKNIDVVNELEREIKENSKSAINMIVKIFNKKIKKIKSSIMIDEKPINDVSDYKKIVTIIKYDIERKKIDNKINKLLDELNSEENISINNFENEVYKNLNIALNWYEEVWLKIFNEIKNDIKLPMDINQRLMSNSFNVKRVMKEIWSELIICDMEKQVLVNDYEAMKINWLEYEEFTFNYKKISDDFKLLNDAIVKKDIGLYREAIENILDLYDKKDILGRRRELIKIISNESKKWADDISKRKGVHSDIKILNTIEKAWKNIQLKNQLEKIDSYDPKIIQKEIEKIKENIIVNTRELANKKAWFEKNKNQTQEQIQALEGWKQTMKRIGKGKGKRAEEYKKRARDLMTECQTAIPVWIMPLNKVVENFTPDKNKFDVVIIDEASQANMLALSALYLGKKVIIVGDDEQVSPDGIEKKTDELKSLTEQYLGEMANNHLFSYKTSIYDIAKRSGFKTLMLTEHFRCLPEIIEFSNQLSYNGKIKPLRDTSDVKITPAVVEYRVTNGVKKNRVNTEEALQIASLVCACIENENYKNKTIGIISLQGEKQADEINTILQKKLKESEYYERKIQCGTSSQFQGDERDIIFLSVVESPKETEGTIRLLSEDGNNDRYKKIYNVATSRAKDQMWVVHSLNPEIDLKSEDIRLKLINYAMNPKILQMESKIKKAESDFEEKVMSTLLNKGYKVTPQYKVGNYRIDMVIIDGVNKIALECDGERWHTQDNYYKDLERQEILERVGWKFIRIRGSAYYRAPEEAMKIVYLELEKYNIKPDYTCEVENKTEENEIIKEIKLMSNRMIMEWRKAELELENEILISENYIL